MTLSWALYAFDILLAGTLIAILDAWRKLRRVLKEIDRIRARWEREDGYGSR